MASSNSALSATTVKKLNMLITTCSAFAETTQRLAHLVTEASGADECAKLDREHLAHAISHISNITCLLADEGEKLLIGLPESDPDLISPFVGKAYADLCEKEITNESA